MIHDYSLRTFTFALRGGYLSKLLSFSLDRSEQICIPEGFPFPATIYTAFSSVNNCWSCSILIKCISILNREIIIKGSQLCQLQTMYWSSWIPLINLSERSISYFIYPSYISSGISSNKAMWCYERTWTLCWLISQFIIIMTFIMSNYEARKFSLLQTYNIQSYNIQSSEAEFGFRFKSGFKAFWGGFGIRLWKPE